MAVVIAGLAIAVIERLRQTRQTNELRHQVFCNEIRPGMDELQVASVLLQHGQFTESRSSFGSLVGSFEVIYVAFNDPTVHNSFGVQPIVLSFDNGKFVRATLPTFSDAYDPICP